MEQQSANTTITVVAVPLAARVNDFFMAFSWPGNVYTSPIPTQPYYLSGCPENRPYPCLHENLYRHQWNGMWDWQPVAAWAADPRHRGQLYTLGDDEAVVGFGGLYIHDPRRYAADYCTFVSN